MRACEPDREDLVEVDGVKLHYEVYGDEHDPTVLLLPASPITHSREWKGQIPDLARHAKVVTYDGRGNGRSDRPTDPQAYTDRRNVDDALAVLDAAEVDRAVLVTHCHSARWGFTLATEQPDRVHGIVAIAPGLPFLTPPHPHGVDAHEHFDDPAEGELTGWRTMNRQHWLAGGYRDWVEFFFTAQLPEPHSTKQIEDAVAWAMETSVDVMLAGMELGADGVIPSDAEAAEEMCRNIGVPVLVVHGDQDICQPVERGERVAELTGGELLVMAGSGHQPHGRDPVRVNLAIRDFLGRFRPAAPRAVRWIRGRERRKRVLYLSSPIGLGHARRDVAVAQQLRALHPDVEVDWLAQDPVTRVLEAEGERVHPASRYLANESAHIEAECGEHDLHAFQAIRDMDEILVANFMLFNDVVTEGHYDLVVGDEAWEVDHFLHENPELKRFAFAWFTDFVGWLPMPEGGSREAAVVIDYNAEMIEHLARFPRVRDQSIFVGDPDDIVPARFGEGLPAIREWTEAHYDFAGYVTGFDPSPLADRDALREQLGYAPDEQVCIVTVGGSGVGEHLLRRVIAGYPAAKRAVPALRMVVVAGPRIDPAGLPSHDGLEVHAFVPGLYRHLAACDLAVVQGGLTTCMELTAAGRPFIYVPLRGHFEQNLHVAHRLDRYRAGHRLDYDHADPDHLAELIATHIGQPTHYRPVETDGAARAAALLAELL
jgi:pimeloyl-ACP methyl ester carboxylesterase/predicted glycosyltransferase